MPATAVYRGVQPTDVGTAIELTLDAANALVAQLQPNAIYDPAVNLDVQPDVRARWVDWRMPHGQHIRLERHEPKVWRLMTRGFLSATASAALSQGGGKSSEWRPWYYLPERTATFVGAGFYGTSADPIAVVMYGADAVFLVRKRWYERQTRGARAAGSPMTISRERQEPDWADLDLSGIGDPAGFRPLFEPTNRAFWLLPWRDGAVDVGRTGWRFEVRFPGGVATRMATRVKIVDLSQNPPAQNPPAQNPPAQKRTSPSPQVAK